MVQIFVYIVMCTDDIVKRLVAHTAVVTAVDCCWRPLYGRSVAALGYARCSFNYPP